MEAPHHPLPVGTQCSYADLSPRVNCTILMNDNTSAPFRHVVDTMNAQHTEIYTRLDPSHPYEPVPYDDLDYVILVDGELGVLPVQADGIRLERVSIDEHAAGLI